MLEPQGLSDIPPRRSRRDSQHRISDRVHREVLDSGPCAYCGALWPTHVDHVIPFSRGGTSERDNLAPSCETCNMEKLNLTPDEWRAWRESRGLSWPPKSIQALLRDDLGPVLAAAPSEVLAGLNQALKEYMNRGRQSLPPIADYEGACTHCSAIYQLRRDGTVRRHKIQSEVCPGAGRLPRKRDLQ